MIKMINSAHSCFCSRYSDALTVVVICSYRKGVEVFNSYGRRGNENLLMEYGFAMEDNMWDEVRMYVSLFQALVYLR